MMTTLLWTVLNMMIALMTMMTNDYDDDFDEEEDGHLAMDNGKCVNPDPPSAIFKLDCMVE